jgi:probable F420-dependent oxidoreductase
MTAAHLVREAKAMATGKTPCGIAIPQVFGDTAADINLIQQFVQKAETLGYESLWVQESIVGQVPVLEPLSLLTYAAALTSRLRLGTSVMLTVLRNPVQLAKLVASLDQLSQGRLTVGIGIGGHVPESIFGLPSGQRVRRFVEGIQVMKALWTQSRAQVSGTFWQFQNVAMEPKPVQKPHPPIWFGARQAPALQRAVRHGDGWMGAGSSSTADFLEQYGLLRRFLDEAKRDPATFTVSKRVYLARESDLSQRPEGQTVLDLIVDGRPTILLLKAMCMNPELIWTVQLLIHKLLRRVPASNPGLPA